jgi:DNA-binding GntR family transcriptional regulator
VRQLTERFGISATPVREALMELEAVGVIEISHNRGAVVRPFGPDQLREIYQLRRILEAEAARTACGRIEHSVLEQLRHEMQTLAEDQPESAEWPAAAMQADRRLHDLIAQNCGSARLAGEINRYNSLIWIGGEKLGNSARQQARQAAIQDHLAILDALLANDAEESAQQMARHIDRTADHVTRVMFGSSES